MRGSGISMCTVKESLAALQRQNKIDKDNRCTEYTFLCSLAIDKKKDMFLSISTCLLVICKSSICTGLILLVQLHSSLFTHLKDDKFVKLFPEG